jgi:hypothetical protein
VQQRTGPPTTTVRTVTITMAAVHDDAPEVLSVELVGEAFVVGRDRPVGADVMMEE